MQEDDDIVIKPAHEVPASRPVSQEEKAPKVTPDPALDPNEPPYCFWQRADGQQARSDTVTWSSQCGEALDFPGLDGLDSPEDTGMEYCCFCGKTMDYN